MPDLMTQHRVLWREVSGRTRHLIISHLDEALDLAEVKRNDPDIIASSVMIDSRQITKWQPVE